MPQRRATAAKNVQGVAPTGFIAAWPSIDPPAPSSPVRGCFRAAVGATRRNRTANATIFDTDPDPYHGAHHHETGDRCGDTAINHRPRPWPSNQSGCAGGRRSGVSWGGCDPCHRSRRRARHERLRIMGLWSQCGRIAHGALVQRCVATRSSPKKPSTSPCERRQVP